MKSKNNHSDNITPDTGHSSNKRRQALKNIALGGGLISAASMAPQKWVRPVVDSVILPSHANTSDDNANLPGAATTTLAPVLDYTFGGIPQTVQSGIDEKTQNIASRLLDTAIPTAQAYDDSKDTYYACLAITGNSYSGKIVIQRYGYYYDEYANISGTVGTPGTHTVTSQFCISGSSNIIDINLLVEGVTSDNCTCTITELYRPARVFTASAGTCGEPLIFCDK